MRFEDGLVDNHGGDSIGAAILSRVDAAFGESLYRHLVVFDLNVVF